MRTLLFVSAAVHAALFALVFLTSTLDVMLAAVLGVAFALAFGLLALIRNGPIPTMWVAGSGAGMWRDMLPATVLLLAASGKIRSDGHRCLIRCAAGGGSLVNLPEIRAPEQGKLTSVRPPGRA